MVKKIVILSFLIVFVCAAAIVGVIFLQKKTEKPLVLETITLGWNEWPGNLPYLVAYEKGFFKDEGVKVELKKEDGYGATLGDLIGGKIDCSGNMILVDVLVAVGKGEDLAVVGVTDYSVGADGIVGQKNIKSVSDLKGKKVAVEEGTLGEFLLIKALQGQGLTIKDVEMINFNAQDAVAALYAEKVDAAVTYEPFLSEAVKNRNKIFTSADYPYLISDTLVFHKDFINTNPKAVQAVVNAYFRAVEYIKDNSEEAYIIGAQYHDIAVDEFKVQLSGLNILDRNENLIAFSHATGEKSLYLNGSDLLVFLQELGKIDGDINLDDVILRRFVKSLAY